MKIERLLLVGAVVGMVACHGNDKAVRKDQQYDVVAGGSGERRHLDDQRSRRDDGFGHDAAHHRHRRRHDDRLQFHSRRDVHCGSSGWIARRYAAAPLLSRRRATAVPADTGAARASCAAAHPSAAADDFVVAPSAGAEGSAAETRRTCSPYDSRGSDDDYQGSDDNGDRHEYDDVDGTTAAPSSTSAAALADLRPSRSIAYLDR